MQAQPKPQNEQQKNTNPQATPTPTHAAQLRPCPHLPDVPRQRNAAAPCITNPQHAAVRVTCAMSHESAGEGEACVMCGGKDTGG